MNLDPQYHLPPGRQAAVDALVSERFSDPIWFRSVPAEVLDPQMQALRQLELNELPDDEDDIEEATNGSVEETAVRDSAARRQHLSILRSQGA